MVSFRHVLIVALAGLGLIAMACDNTKRSPVPERSYCKGFAQNTGRTCSCGTREYEDSDYGDVCLPPADQSGMCCAGSDWPTGSKGCICGRVGCLEVKATANEPGYCACGAYFVPTPPVDELRVAVEACYPGGTAVPPATSTALKCCLGKSSCRCEATTKPCTNGVQVDSCTFANSKLCTSEDERLIDQCVPDVTASGSSGTSGTSGSSTSCSDKGFCGPNTDRCACGTTCIRLAVGSYSCGESCNNDSDCTGKKDPQSGQAYTRCAKATLAGFCS